MPVTNQPWGTITKPPFDLGYQKLSEDEVDRMVERLSKTRQQSAQTKRTIPAIEKRQLNKQEIQSMVDRLANKETLSAEEIEQQVKRLYVPDWSSKVKDKLRPPSRRAKVEPLDMGSEEIDKMVERLTRNASHKATDQNRTGSMKEQGVVNTYMWKGWN